MTIITQYYISDINSKSVYKAHNMSQALDSESTKLSNIDINSETHNYFSDY